MNIGGRMYRDDILIPHLKDGVELYRINLEDRLSISTYSGAAVYVLGFQNGKYYIGSTKRFRHRMAQHRSYLRAGSHINENLQLEYLNDNVVTVTYLELPEKSDAALLEESLLEVNYGLLNCLNKTPSARGMANFDQTAKSAKLKALFSTPEQKEKKSLNSKAMWANPEYRERMLTTIGHSVIVDGNSYHSFREASRETGYSIAALRAHNKNGVVNSCNIKINGKRVSCEGTIYDTLRIAAMTLGISETTLHWRINHTNPKWSEYHYI